MEVSPRFLTLGDVAEILNTSMDQVYALVRRGELRGIKIGGRGQWRVESSALEEFIAAGYEATREFIASHPYEGRDEVDEPAKTPGPADEVRPSG